MEIDDNYPKYPKYQNFDGKVLTYEDGKLTRFLTLGVKVVALQDFPPYITMNQLLKVTKFYIARGGVMLAHFDNIELGYPVSAFADYNFNPINFWNKL